MSIFRFAFFTVCLALFSSCEKDELPTSVEEALSTLEGTWYLSRLEGDFAGNAVRYSEKDSPEQLTFGPGARYVPAARDSSDNFVPGEPIDFTATTNGSTEYRSRRFLALDAIGTRDSTSFSFKIYVSETEIVKLYPNLLHPGASTYRRLP